MTQPASFPNPFRPGAGHMPPYLAGRKQEEAEFKRLLSQTTILENAVLTGLRGVGKTVLLDTFKPLAIAQGWLWVGTDLSETVSVSETNLATRIITDLSVVTSAFNIDVGSGLVRPMNFASLQKIFDETPGLIIDKLKNLLELVSVRVAAEGKKGIVFAYDEAQNLSDNAARDQYPLSVLLDVFQSLQKKNIPFMLALVGLPTLFPKLVEARTYSERMFRVISLSQLSPKDSKEAITKPVETAACPITFDTASVETISNLSGGYPYFIQFICREVYDIWIQRLQYNQSMAIPVEELTRKLDTDFFAGRWAKATDRQRELLYSISQLETCDSEFTVQEISEISSVVLQNGFSSSHASQMLVTLINTGIIYKNRYGKYSFAVPLMSGFVSRQYS